MGCNTSDMNTIHQVSISCKKKKEALYVSGVRLQQPQPTLKTYSSGCLVLPQHYYEDLEKAFPTRFLKSDSVLPWNLHGNMETVPLVVPPSLSEQFVLSLFKLLLLGLLGDWAQVYILYITEDKLRC